MIQYQSIFTILLISPALAQFAAIQPDVRFGDDNDRYDITNIIQDTNRLYRKHQQVSQEDEFRRDLKIEEDLGFDDDMRSFSARKTNDNDNYGETFISLDDFMKGIQSYSKTARKTNDNYNHRPNTWRKPIPNYEERDTGDRRLSWRRLAKYIDDSDREQIFGHSGGFRRSGSSLASGRRSIDEYYHEKKPSTPVPNYEENLKRFMTPLDRLRFWRRMADDDEDHSSEEQGNRRNGRQGFRRSGDVVDESEVLMQYAVPIAMNIDGYLRVPLK